MHNSTNSMHYGQNNTGTLISEREREREREDQIGREEIERKREGKRLTEQKVDKTANILTEK